MKSYFYPTYSQDFNYPFFRFARDLCLSYEFATMPVRVSRSADRGIVGDGAVVHQDGARAEAAGELHVVGRHQYGVG